MAEPTTPKTDKELLAQPCKACGGSNVVRKVLYSCPAWYDLQCTGCGVQTSVQGVEGIKIRE